MRASEKEIRRESESEREKERERERQSEREKEREREIFFTVYSRFLYFRGIGICKEIENSTLSYQTKRMRKTGMYDVKLKSIFNDASVVL